MSVSYHPMLNTVSLIGTKLISEQYLGSLLGTSGPGGEHATPSTKAKSRPESDQRRPQAVAQANEQHNSIAKRKAIDNLSDEPKKISRTASAINPPKIDSVSSVSTQIRANDTLQRNKSGSEQDSAQRKQVKAAPRPTAAAAAASAPPHKGSFAEIMARAKALQATKLGQGPKFTHKAVSQTPDELKDRKRKEATSRTLGKRAPSTRPSSRSGSEEVRKQKSANLKNKVGQKIVEKPKRKPIEVSYKGTMRPTPGQPGSRGTATSQYSGGFKNQPRDVYGSHRDRYNERDEEDDEEDDYDSAASSDMEAGAWDIDEEEELALQKARAEDAAAKREEDEHRRQKQARKEGFDMAAARRR